MKKTLLAAGLALALCSACIGPNRLWHKLHDWNMEASDERWAREGIFVVFHVVPIYPLAYLGDIVVFNSVEWWGGDPMIDYETRLAQQKAAAQAEKQKTKQATRKR